MTGHFQILVGCGRRGKHRDRGAGKDRVWVCFPICRRSELQYTPGMSEAVVSQPASFGAATGMAEAGRIALARQLTVIRVHDDALRKEGSATAVHETRKAIRRIRTLFKLLEPYFLPHTFRRYRRCLKKLMRQLGRARDLEVCLQKLQHFRKGERGATGEGEALAALWEAWQTEKAKANAAARQAARQPAYRECLDAFESFTVTTGAGVPPASDWFAPNQVRHLAPIHIYERLAAVRAFEEEISGASVPELHRLRICFKELRYTLEFFAPVLGREMERVLVDLNGIQDHLGDLNDTRVALELLAETKGPAAAVERYRSVQQAEMARLVDSFRPVWDTFNNAAWRGQVTAALSDL